MTDRSPTSPVATTLAKLLTPVPDQPAELVSAFYQEQEETAAWIVVRTNYLCTICVFLSLINFFFLTNVPYHQWVLLSLIASGLAFALVSQFPKWPFPVKSYTAASISLIVVHSSLVAASLTGANNFISLIIAILLNSLIVAIPWPPRPTRFILAFIFIFYITFNGLVSHGNEADTFRFGFTLLMIASSGSTFIFHSVFLQQRWHSFLDQQQIQRLHGQLIAQSAELERSNQDLEANNAELDAFAHTVAHDLNQPLQVIGQYAELLNFRNDERYANLPNLTERIIQMSHQITAIVNELLLLSSVRYEDVAKSRLDMTDIIQNALIRLENLIEDHHAVITLPQQWPAALGYAPWVEEIWANYLSNALKYGGNPCQIELGADQTADDDGHIRFWVQDNGVGIPKEKQADLFVEFSRVHTRGSGHGLGLSIVKRVADKLGGTVGVNSEEGNGSRFYFTLPAAPSTPQPPAD